MEEQQPNFFKYAKAVRESPAFQRFAARQPLGRQHARLMAALFAQTKVPERVSARMLAATWKRVATGTELTRMVDDARRMAQQLQDDRRDQAEVARIQRKYGRELAADRRQRAAADRALAQRHGARNPIVVGD